MVRYVFALLFLAPCFAAYASAQSTPVAATVAGATRIGSGPLRGFAGDGGPARESLLALAELQNECDPGRFEQISHIALDASGNLYVADSGNQRIRRINPQGIIDTFAGNGERPPTNPQTCVATGGAAAIGDGNAATAAKLYGPAGVAVHPNGSLIIADQQSNRIRQVSPGGAITTIAGNGLHSFYAPQVPATSSGLDWPTAVAVSTGGEIHFSELHSGRVARIALDGRLLTVAGTGIPGFNGESGPATSLRLSNPTGIAFDSDGNLFIADQGNHRIRKVSPAGFLTTIAGGNPGFAGDGGLAASAQFDRPADVKVDRAGNIYVTDMNNHRVRRIDSSGIIDTVAGNGTPARGADGVPATASSLALPTGLAIDAAGDLFVVDWNNYIVRKIVFSGQAVIGSSAVVNGASFAPGPIAPGSIFSVFGVNLSSAIATATQVPLPTELAGTTLRVNGQAVPLYFVSPGQINAQLPYRTGIGQAQLTVATAQGTGPPEPAGVTESSIGVFVHGLTNRAVALNQDNSVNAPERAETRGRTLTIFITGIGLVTPEITTGEAAGTAQLHRAASTVSATIGGIEASIDFVGLTPGFVGLAQTNVAIPEGAPTGGDVPLVLHSGGQASKVTVVSIQ